MRKEYGMVHEAKTVQEYSSSLLRMVEMEHLRSDVPPDIVP
jgi:hypothetical protein